LVVVCRGGCSISSFPIVLPPVGSRETNLSYFFLHVLSRLGPIGRNSLGPMEMRLWREYSYLGRDGRQSPSAASSTGLFMARYPPLASISLSGLLEALGNGVADLSFLGFLDQGHTTGDFVRNGLDMTESLAVGTCMLITVGCSNLMARVHES